MRRPFCCPISARTPWGATLAGMLVLLFSPVLSGQESAPAEEPEQQRITFDEHIQPLFRQHCFLCHNQNAPLGGLAVDSYAALMEGGSSGAVVEAGDPGGSRLWRLVAHEEQPIMPPNQDPLPDEQLQLIRQWIEAGVLESADSEAAPKKKKASVALTAPVTTERPEQPAMPERLWKQPVVWTSQAAAVTAVASSPWAPVVAVAGQRQVVLYHADTAERLGILPFPEGVPHVVRFSRDGSVLLVGGGRGGASGYAALYDLKTGRRLVRVGDELDVVLAADVSPDLSRIALGGPQRLVRVYSTATGELLHEIDAHNGWVYALEYSPDGVLLASADRANGLLVWEADTARLWLELAGHNQPVTDVSWRADSNVLASCSLDGTIRLWEMNQGNTIRNWNAHGDGAMAVAFARQGQLVSAGRDRLVKTWSPEGAADQEFSGLSEIALAAAFTHDAARVLGGDWSGNVRMWPASGGEPLAELSPNPPTLQAVLERATQQRDQARQTLEALRSQQAAAEQTVADRTAAVAAASEAAAAAEETADRARAEQETATEAAEQAAAAVEQAAAAAEQAAAAAEQAAAEATDSQSEQAAAELAQATEARNAAMAEHERAQQQVREKTDAAQLAAAQADEARTALHTAEQNKIEAQQLLAPFAQQVETAQQQQARTESAVQQAAADYQAFQQVAEQLVVAVEETQQQAEQYSTRLLELDSEREMAEQQAREYGEIVAPLQQSLAELQAQLDRALEDQRRAEGELREQNDALEATREALDAAEQAASAAAAEREIFEAAYGKP